MQTTDDDTTAHVPGAPAHELARSSASRAVAQLAARSGLRMYHYEHRVQLPPPAHWLPDDRPDLGRVEGWQRGVLPESKYVSFRHDLLIGSFHPGHRAKWTGHELLHGLVGFAWRPDATALFNALAARLAEVLPVALWYFFDEADLARCPRHDGQGPLYGTFCAACERAAATGPRTTDAGADWIARGRAFVEAELASVARARRLGRPDHRRHATLDLMEDGLAYAAAQTTRLRSPEVAALVHGFFPEGSGRHDSLDALEARIVELLGALMGEGAATPLATTPGRVVAQDVAFRLLTIRADCEGECADGLTDLVEGLAAAPDALGVGRAVVGYQALHDAFDLPVPGDVFAVGYELLGEGSAGLGRSRRQVAQGLASCLPETLRALGDRLPTAIDAFTRADGFERTPIATRFARWLEAEMPDDPAVERAVFEAAVATVEAPDPGELSLGWDGANATEVVRARGVALASDDGQPVAIRRDAEGEVHVYALPDAAVALLRALEAGPVSVETLQREDAGMLEALASAGLIAPDRWSLALT